MREKMNALELVYAFSEEGKDDFKIRGRNNRENAFDVPERRLRDDDSDSTATTTDDDGGADERKRESPAAVTTPTPTSTPMPDVAPKFFRVNEEEVAVLANAKGSRVYVLGTNHASPESRQAVDSLIEAVKPQVVVVELCKTRIGLNPLKTFQRNRPFDLYLLKDAVVELGISAGFIWYSMAYMERFVSRLLNVDYGGDMRAPGASASVQVTNADLLRARRRDYKIMLGDRPIEVTIKRMASVLTWPEKVAVWFFNVCSAVLGLRCYLLNVPTVLFRSAQFNRVLLDERDVYLTYSLQMASNVPANGPVRVIGVVGKAHVAGILRRWDTVTEEEVRRISSDNAR